MILRGLDKVAIVIYGTYRRNGEIIYMSLIDDGVIKFDHSSFKLSPPLEIDEYRDLENWRKTLFAKELIGEYPIEKVGFGNLSQRKDYQSYFESSKPQFLISGTQTGKFSHLTGEHYTRVIDYDLGKNKVTAMGPVQASSESLTHAAIYELDKKIKAIFHIHHRDLWDCMLRDGAVRTPKDIPYGTQEMARCVQKLFAGKPVGLFAMEGHQDGIIAFATDLNECGKLIEELYFKYH